MCFVIIILKYISRKNIIFLYPYVFIEMRCILLFETEAFNYKAGVIYVLFCIMGQTLFHRYVTVYE